MPVSQQISHVFLANTPQSLPGAAPVAGTIGGTRKEWDLPQWTKKEFFLVLLQIEAVQRELNVSRSTVYRLLRAGQLDAVHIGSAIRISQESLDSYIASHTTYGTAVAR